MKTLKLIPALALAGWLLPAPSAPGLETTGQVIEKLVSQVDEKLAALEALTAKQSAGEQSLRNQLDEQLALYDQATNATERAAIRGEIIGLMARLNKADRAEVAATMDTVVNIVETMKKLQSAMKSELASNSDQARDQQTQVTRFIQNSARVLKAVERIEDTTPGGKDTAGLKNSLIMLSHQMRAPTTSVAGALGRINDSMQALEDVAVQLRILHDTLDNEHDVLVASTHVQTVNLALLRLARARLGVDSVADIPASRNNEILERTRKSWGPISESEATLTGASAGSADEEFSQLANGEPEWVSTAAKPNQ